MLNMEKTRNILVICGDYYHSKEIVQNGLTSFEHFNSRFNFHFVVDAKNSLTSTSIDSYDMIMICKGNQVAPHDQSPWFEAGVTEVTPKELETYISKGKAILVVHAGLFFDMKTAPEYVQLVGSEFVIHPPRCDVEVKMKENHPITDGIEDFIIRDEHYEIKLYGENDCVLFHTISAAGGTQVGGYTKHLGNGRICVLTPGHILEVWQHPMFQKLLINAILWCCKE